MITALAGLAMVGFAAVSMSDPQRKIMAKLDQHIRGLESRAIKVYNLAMEGKRDKLFTVDPDWDPNKPGGPNVSQAVECQLLLRSSREAIHTYRNATGMAQRDPETFAFLQDKFDEYLARHKVSTDFAVRVCSPDFSRKMTKFFSREEDDGKKLVLPPPTLEEKKKVPRAPIALKPDPLTARPRGGRPAAAPKKLPKATKVWDPIEFPEKRERGEHLRPAIVRRKGKD